MKLKISSFKEPKHVGVVVCVSWNNTEDVFSCGSVKLQFLVGTYLPTFLYFLIPHHLIEFT